MTLGVKRLRMSTGIYTPLQCSCYQHIPHDQKNEQMWIKFYQKLGKTCTETYNMIKMAFWEESISHTQVFEWCHCFKEGQTSVEGDKHPGWPLTCTNSEMIDIVRNLLESDRRLMIRESPKKMEFDQFMSCSCDWRCGHEMRGSAVHSVSADSRTEGKLLFKATNIFQCTESDADLIGKIITGNRTWI